MTIVIPLAGWANPIDNSTYHEIDITASPCPISMPEIRAVASEQLKDRDEETEKIHCDVSKNIVEYMINPIGLDDDIDKCELSLTILCSNN